MSNLNKEQESELIDILNGVSENINKNEITENSNITPVGWHTTNVVIAMSYGYVGGAIASYLIGWATGYTFAMFGSSMGIVGTIVSGVLGYIIGSWIESKVNSWIERSGVISGFRWQITSLSVWWLWGSSNKDFNLVDLLFYIIGKTGGKMGYGARPVNVPAPKVVKA